VARKTTKVRTKAELARELGVTKGRVSQWSRDWPFGQRGPFDVERVRAWQRDTFAEQPAPYAERSSDEMSQLQRASLLLKVKQAARIDRQIKHIDRHYIDRADAQKQIAAVLANFQSVLLAGPQQQAHLYLSNGLLAARPDAVDEVRDHMTRWLESVLVELAEGFRNVADRRD
jgi:hypothetical protein